MLSKVLFLAEESEGLDIPTMQEFLPDPIFFGGTIFELNRLQLIRFIVVLFILLFFGITLSRAKKRADADDFIPSKPQMLIEMLFEFIKNFVFESLGEKAGKRWLPMMTTMFCTIIFMNLTGLVPTLNLAATAGVGIPLLFAIWVFTSYWREGIRDHGGGVKGFFVFIKAEVFPPGLPFFVYPIYSLIEIAQLLFIRPVSLALRLLANMIAGHILIALCFAATQFFLFVAEPSMKALGVVTFAGSILFTCFELLVAALQAYIFTLLACAYISMSFAHGDDHSEAPDFEEEGAHTDDSVLENPLDAKLEAKLDVSPEVRSA
ncbi:MAG: F0F1 ATP synthase subunit A [Candidatus Ancillula sp.]|jgi:F-type H+-transporting ATPase subunit a|nr:F0F1 ATP synthase subunit A [Candidatus Ancillula sp.]